MRQRELTALERRVWRAFGSGEPLDLRPRPRRGDVRGGESWPPQRRLPAEFLVELLTIGERSEYGGVPALRLAGAAIDGELRLEAAEVPHLVDLTECWFSHRLDLRMARLAGLRLPGCRVPGLRGHNLSVDSDLVLEAGFSSTGQVDLTDAHVAGSLRLSGAVLRQPGGTALLADRLVASGAIQATALRATGSVRLPNARIGGSIDLGAAMLSNPQGDALHALGIEVSGSLLAEVYGGRFTADGRIVLSGARIGGDLRLSGAKLTVPESPDHPVLVIPRGIADGSAALVADRIEVRGNVELDDGFTATGTVRLPGAQIGGYLRLAGATLGTPTVPPPAATPPSGSASTGTRPSETQPSEARPSEARPSGTQPSGTQPFEAQPPEARSVEAATGLPAAPSTEVEIEPEVETAAEMLVESPSDTTATTPAGGEQRLQVALLADGVRVNGDLDGRGWRHDDPATSRPGLIAYGQVRLVDAYVRGSVSLSNMELNGPGLDVLFADRFQVGGTLFMRNAQVAGSVRLQDANIGSTLDCTGATLTEPRRRPDGTPKPSLDVRVSTIGKDLFCTRGFSATGGVRVRRLEASKTVSFEQATLGGEPGAVALNALALRTQELNVRFARPPLGDVLLTRASAVEVFDDEVLWQTKGKVDLEDFDYQTLTAPTEVDVVTRLRWLRSVLPHYDPDPYDTLAASYADAGREERSRRVLLANERHRHASMRLPGRIWGWVQEVTVGYGYRPLLALLWFLAAWTAGAIWFARFYTPTQIDPEHRPAFNPVLFALDTLLPIVNLGQDAHWRTVGASQWIAATLTLVGWILVSTAATGAARVLKRN